ncbi:hypothetical protein H112_06470 [Trichophyton rubrum D6]|uniref:Uncharacterized protein n=3 Tax=Trichophyton TaxID=5550 RepID=A0A080WEU6_TRIRC|nr:uncharacterized protein TERG_11765 [Trichophyton rubrum CBS 118892]EZF13052.1 hypothetical protein H100_06484 [Trichophyton rubrum MR850]EZF39443.1 hypothetical protein H102_06451 [Trichophyton rubrum CBS 100081]EZF50039.1 hypothetical protein H103_06478 [Trichophyton rubrum CBS 288.86]EZF60672.1 hypothetical protein H104_06461 [Trichophyton rubrum CBS 289.86]EZF71283.1 hypothetical protein H105_06489 [Trichophyton soudanense CBS 452.61]EZF81976.1 hypothetical protein H110_06473 [Trichophy
MLHLAHPGMTDPWERQLYGQCPAKLGRHRQDRILSCKWSARDMDASLTYAALTRLRDGCNLGVSHARPVHDRTRNEVTPMLILHLYDMQEIMFRFHMRMHRISWRCWIFFSHLWR